MFLPQSNVYKASKVYKQFVVCVALQYLGSEHSLQGLKQLVGVVCEHPSILLKHAEQGASLAEQRGDRKKKIIWDKTHRQTHTYTATVNYLLFYIYRGLSLCHFTPILLRLHLPTIRSQLGEIDISS